MVWFLGKRDYRAEYGITPPKEGIQGPPAEKFGNFVFQKSIWKILYHVKTIQLANEKVNFIDLKHVIITIHVILCVKLSYVLK